VLNQTAPQKLAAALAPVLDLDGALKFLALDNAFVNNDGYWIRSSDYSIYLDSSRRFHILPYDINEAFAPGSGGFGGGRIGGSADLDPLSGLDDPSKPLRSRLLAVPALRTKYLADVRDIAMNWMTWSRLEPFVRQYRALIAADVRSDTHKLYSTDEFDRGEAALRAFVDARHDRLLAATAGSR